MTIESARRELAELAELAAHHRTDKSLASITRRSLRSRHALGGRRYTETYARFFAESRGGPVKLLEIGIDWVPRSRLGGLLPARHVRGDRRQGALPEVPDRRHHRSHWHPDRHRLPAICERGVSPFDMVIDDGGHTMEQHHVGLVTL